MRDSRRKLQNNSIYPSKKLMGLILQTFKVFVWKALQQWTKMFRKTCLCIDIVDRSVTGELTRRSVGKHSNTVRLKSYSSHICYVSNIKALFKTYRCPSCDQIINTADYLERHLITCKKTVRLIFPQNLYQLREKPYNKLDTFNIPYSDDPKLCKNMEISHFGSIGVPEDRF